MEAMKMQTAVYAPVDGKVMEELLTVSDKAKAKDFWLVLG